MARKIHQYLVSVVAEATTVSLFARCGYDVSVQYKAGQPKHDLMASKDSDVFKIQVKGSQDGGWGLTQSFKKADKSYHDAIKLWVDKFTPNTIVSLVQIQNVQIDELPRVYLATPQEVATRLRESSNGRGETILFENKVWTEIANGYGTIDKIPDEWKFSEKRIQELIKNMKVR